MAARWCIGFGGLRVEWNLGNLALECMGGLSVFLCKSG